VIGAIAWAAAGVAACAVAADVGARAWLRARGRVWVHRPHARRELRIATDVLPGLSPVARFEANADGERGGPVPRDPARTTRWSVAGGSAAECYLLDQGETWAAVMERALAARTGEPVHVGSVARSLAPCARLAALLDRALAHVRGLDGVVLMVGASDLVAWFEEGAPPTPGARRIEVGGEPRLDDLADEHPFGPFRWTRPRRSAAWRIARRAHARHFGATEVRERAGASIAAHRARRAAARNVRDEAPDPAGMLDVYRRDLGALLDVLQRRAPRVVVALQPWLDAPLDAAGEARLWNFGQGSPYRGEVDTYFSSRLVRELMARIEEAPRSVALARGLETVELRSVVPSDLEHYYDMLHFTPAGAALVGAEVARAIEDGSRGTRRSAA